MVSLLYLQIAFLFSVKLLWLQANASGNVTDHYALLKFKKAISSDPYGILNSWNDSIPFCNWFGIKCSPRNQRVTVIDLLGQNLHGSISPYIGNLSFLTVIDLQNNSLYGGIPQEIGQLFQLRLLFLNHNTLEGEIPISITNCSQLREMSLRNNNKIAGIIPVEIGSLTKLRILELRSNNLIGEIPSSIGNISALDLFDVTYNNMEGSIPEEMGKLANLIFFGVGVNKFSGVIPPSIFNITSLNAISIAKNQFHGSLPDNICFTLPNLQHFGAGGNSFSGAIPTSISNCSQLDLIDISQNNFVGQVPIDLGKLQRLSLLNLGFNNLGSYLTDDLAFITSLSNCSKLQVLGLNTNRFGGPLSGSAANLSTQLLFFYIGDNQISGMVPAGLDNLVNLISLGMEANLFTGSIPSYFGNLQHLQLLDLGQNKFSGEIPFSLGNLTQLAEFQLSGNRLEGSIPASIGNCQMLRYLDLSSNNLNGEIPPQVLLLPSLSLILNLSRNMLVGVLPPEVGKLKYLNLLDLAENNFTGKIPESIGECQNLELLYLQGNSFEGTIPSTLVSLRGLQELDLSRNNLLGEIPEDLQNLTFLKYLNLSFNYLEGEVPTGGIFKNASAISLRGNNKLCGGIPELNLPKCLSKRMQKGKAFTSKIAIVIVCLVVLVLLVPALLHLYWKRNSKSKSLSSTSIGKHLIKVSYGDLYRATGGFSSDCLIGTGGFSSVYKGSLVQVEKLVAVKILNLEKKGATKSFKAECRVLRNVRHRNLVKLFTYCSSIDYKGNEFKALVYEFMENGSLEKWLHSSGDNSGILSIFQRLNIAIDVAAALHYLHDLCETPIIHCDLKSSNVLLNNDMVACLSDFGLARLFSTNNDSSQKQTSTLWNTGTVGYAAPEYGTAAVASKEGDVYSYGILLLEMFSGRRPTDEMFKDELNLHAFVKEAMPARLLHIIDPLLLPRDMDDDDGIVLEEVNNDNHAQMTPNMHKCLLSVLEIGLACSVESPKDRMSMMDVTRKLHLIRTEFIGTHRHSGRYQKYS